MKIISNPNIKITPNKFYSDQKGNKMIFLYFKLGAKCVAHKKNRI